jgi:hypothetical protein
MANFNKVEPPLSHFIFAHETLGRSESGGKLCLRDALLKPQVTQHLTESAVFGRKNGFGHLLIVQPKVEYPNLGNSVAIHRPPIAPRRDDLSRSVERLARALRLPKHLLSAHSLRFPDGSLHYTSRFRWCLLIKAVIEQFCAVFTPGGMVICTAKIPDVIIHYPAKNWIVLIEAVISDGPMDGKRRKELKDLFIGCKAGLVFVTAFENRRTMQTFAPRIEWESEVWIADSPTHLIHFSGERFLGPYAPSS